MSRYLLDRIEAHPAIDIHLGAQMLETSRPGVFAAGDVRSGSIKRVASAVGEGAMAVRPPATELSPPRRRGVCSPDAVRLIPPGRGPYTDAMRTLASEAGCPFDRTSEWVRKCLRFWLV